jgi:quercetin dioxygenase-like cupin family protein
MNIAQEITVTTATHPSWSNIEPEQINPLITRQYVNGANMTFSRFSIKKGGSVPIHSHHNAQITHVVEGAFLFTTDGEESILRAGEIHCIPPHVPHGVVALEDTVALEIFSPIRQDWIDGKDNYLRSAAEPSQ